MTSAITAIVLAAGQGSRFRAQSGQDKLLAHCVGRDGVTRPVFEQVLVNLPTCITRRWVVTSPARSEVIRLANSATRADREPVVDLEHAVMAVGASGLRRVIAKSVLRPMFDARGTSLSARAAPQIWHDADNKARLCAALAP